MTQTQAKTKAKAKLVRGDDAGVVLTAAGYRRLLREVQALLDAGRQAAEAAVGAIRARTYFEVGQRVVQEGLTERAGYGDATLRRLSESLDLQLRTLQQAVQFARTYPEAPESTLSWAHYRTLLRVRAPEVRQWYEARALGQGWSTRRLAQAVREDAFALEGGGSQGQVGGKGKGRGTGMARPTEATFVYGGEVLRVLDGDTIEMRLDLGFDVWRKQSIRLAGVDAAPLGTPAGDAARDHVQEVLARAPAVVVKTNRYDVHKRYLGHVLYAQREMGDAEVFEKGRYLNAELLEQGLVAAY